jgi:hypothetical protein
MYKNSACIGTTIGAQSAQRFSSGSVVVWFATCVLQVFSFITLLS